MLMFPNFNILHSDFLVLVRYRHSPQVEITDKQCTPWHSWKNGEFPKADVIICIFEIPE